MFHAPHSWLRFIGQYGMGHIPSLLTSLLSWTLEWSGLVFPVAKVNSNSEINISILASLRNWEKNFTIKNSQIFLAQETWFLNWSNKNTSGKVNFSPKYKTKVMKEIAWNHSTISWYDDWLSGWTSVFSFFDW
jgi:hypothetical protein